MELEAPIAEKIQFNVKFGKILGENRGSGNLMDPVLEQNDNYYWMRDDTRQNQKLLEHIKKENDYFNYILKDKKDLAKQLYCEILISMNENYETVKLQLFLNSKYLYYQKYSAGKSYSQHMRLNIECNKVELLLDENELVISDKELDISNFDINSTEELMSYAIDYESNEMYELRIVNINTKEIIHSIPGLIYCNYEWVNSNLIYYLKGDSSNRLHELYLYNLDTKETVLIFRELNKEYNLSINITLDNKYIILSSGNYNESYIQIINLTDNVTKLIKILDIVDNTRYLVDHSNGYFYIYTNKDNCSNWKICRIKEDLTEEIEDFIPYNPCIYIESFICKQNYLIFTTKINGSTFINVIDYERSFVSIINNINNKNISFTEYTSTDYCNYKIDVVYTIDLSYNKIYETDEIFVSFNTMTQPNKIYKYNLKNLEHAIIWEKIVPNYIPDKYQCERIWININNDKWPLGIPVSLIYKKDQYVKDGTKPLYLYGYGSYGITIEPTFDFKILPLLERGWIYAIAHVRGGSFVNYKWYEDGRLKNKLNTFKDFITVAEYLKSNKYCNDITIEGRSAGGLLVGASMVLRPDLFTNVIAGVPFVDVLNTMCDGTIPLTSEEWTQWGNPNIREDFECMKVYCPYTNIKKTNYPNLFISCGLWDPRVQYWEPLKFISKLREHKTDSNIQIIKITMNQGHFGGSSRYKYIEEIGKQYAFILKK
jgi:oligopeptidase B